MARAGISKEHVFEAIEALISDRQSVTVSSVRDRLGSGSFSTISAHVAAWREANDNRKASDYPEVPETVDKAFRQVWGLAWKASQAGIAAGREGLALARQQMEQERHNMEAEILKLEALNAAQGDEIKKTGEHLTEKTNALSEAQNAVDDLKIENARLDERAKSLESRVGELKDELDKLHARLKEATTKAKAVPRSRKKIDGRNG